MRKLRDALFTIGAGKTALLADLKSEEFSRNAKDLSANASEILIAHPIQSCSDAYQYIKVSVIRNVIELCYTFIDGQITEKLALTEGI